MFSLFECAFDVFLGSSLFEVKQADNITNAKTRATITWRFLTIFFHTVSSVLSIISTFSIFFNRNARKPLPISFQNAKHTITITKILLMIYVTSAPIADAKNPVYRIPRGTIKFAEKERRAKKSTLNI